MINDVLEGRGCQCNVRVSTRWQLSLLLLWFLHWRPTSEIRGTMHLRHNLAMSDACYTEQEYPQDDGHSIKAEGLYTWFTVWFTVECFHLTHICFVTIEKLCNPVGKHMWRIMSNCKDLTTLHRGVHSTFTFPMIWTTSLRLQSKNSYVAIEVWFHPVSWSGTLYSS